MLHSRTKKLFVSMGLSAIPALYLFLLMPFTLYIGNINEFTVSFGAMMQLYASAIIFIVFIFGLFGMFMRDSVYSRYAALLAIIGILIWIQGNLLVWNYGLLDGRAIDWSKNTWRGWLEVAIWGGGLIIVMFADQDHIFCPGLGK